MTHPMDEPGFSARRPAAGALPAFTLPPPNSEVPSMAPITYSLSPPYGQVSSSPLTDSPGASEGLSPSLSSVNTTSSQEGSQAHGNLQYTYSTAQVHGNWPTTANSHYQVGTESPEQQHYGSRSSIYGQQQHHMAYGNPRSSQSPATGSETLPPPPYNNVHQPFQTPVSGGGNGGQHDSHHMSSSVQGTHGAMMHHPTQPHTSVNAPGPVDPYAHSRANSNASAYYSTSSTPQTAGYSPYSAHQQPSPNGTGPRGMSHHHPTPMAPPPGSYRPYSSYQPLATMNGSVMSNMHQPGSQMSMLPASMGLHQGYGQPLMYGGHHHPQPQPQSERPFKCDQCTQSFSRNHDLKRHKRIHLAVKPFPCSFCSKSFSRKDALKRHRLVKGCETKSLEAAAEKERPQDRAGEIVVRSPSGKEA